jgi:hypothetical protein
MLVINRANVAAYAFSAAKDSLLMLLSDGNTLTLKGDAGHVTAVHTAFTTGDSDFVLPDPSLTVEVFRTETAQLGRAFSAAS